MQQIVPMSEARGRRSRVVFAMVLLASAAGCSKPQQQEAEQTATEQAPAPLKEIKLGQTMPYSGPASAYGTIGRVEVAYFKMLNEQGGVNGRKISLLSEDDGYNPAKTVEQTRKLVEQDDVLLLFQSLGTPCNSATQKYLNAKKVPQLFISTGATKWGDPKNYPWTMAFNPSYQLEARTYATYIKEHQPKAKIGVLYQNDDFGKDYLTGLREGLGDKASMIVKEVSYETTDATIDSQLATLQASGADTFFNVSTPKFAAQAIRRAYDSGWKPVQYLANVSGSVGSVLKPAGLDKATGVITTTYLKDPNDKQWDQDPGMKEYKAFMAKYYPEGDLNDANNIYAYAAAQTMVQVLKQCGDDLSRDNVMKQAASLKDYAPNVVLPGIKINTSPDDYFPFDTMQLAKFNGTMYELVAPQQQATAAPAPTEATAQGAATH